MKYAKRLENKIIDIIVADDVYMSTFKDTSAGTWFKIDGVTLGIGYELFKGNYYPPPPYKSWVRNEVAFLWVSPIPYPNDGNFYTWDEDNESWKLIN